MEHTPIIWILGAGFVTMLISLAGLITTVGFFRKTLEKNINLLASFSAGVYLVVGIVLLSEVIEHADTRTIGLTMTAVGSLIMLLLARIPEFHHHHSKDEEHGHSRGAVSRIILSDALHNIGDGLIISVAFASSLHLGLIAMVGIIVHEFLQELSEFFLLRQSGLRVREALKVNFLVSSTVFIGIAIGMLLTAHEGLEGAILGLSAGTILTLVFHDLLPNTARELKRGGGLLKHIIFFILGGALMVLLSSFVGHSH